MISFKPAVKGRLAAAAFALLALGQGVLAQQTAGSDAGLLQYELNTIEVVERYGPSVVAVDVTIAGRTVSAADADPFGFNQLPDFMRQFLPQFQQQSIPARETAGSGFLIDDDGHILTNFHVVSGALESGTTTISDGSAISVSFPNGPDLPVEVVGASSIYDLAVLRPLDPSQIPAGAEPIEFADTDSLRPGQKAIAIGNPFGFESTVTLGIVSAVGRHFPYIGEVDFPLVQTDAPINPGNSGGPLLDSQGRLIGVNTAIVPTVSATGDRGNLGIGFAIPADIVADNIPKMLRGGLESIPNRPRLGVSIQDIANYPLQLRQQLGLPEEGVAILEVEAGSAAEEAGLQGPAMTVTMRGLSEGIPVPTDIIVEANGTPVSSSSQLQNLVFALGDGDTVTLGILRNGERIDVPVTLRVVPQSDN